MRIFLHHTNVSSNKDQLGGVDQYHKDKWNMVSDLGYYTGYNYFCEKDGTRTQTRDDKEETMAQIGNNCDIIERCTGVSYCWAGNFNIEYPSEAQIADLRRFKLEIEQSYGSAEVVRHMDVQDNRTCPGANITIDYLNSILEFDYEDDLKNKEIKRLMGLVESQNIFIKFLLDLIGKYYGKH